MKYNILFLSYISVVVFSACSSNNTPAPQPSPSNNSSKTVLYDVNNIGDPDDDDYCFMLLGADNSGQKKYFKAKMIDIVKDSMEIISGPYTLDSLIDVSTFPAYIKSANSGSYLTDFVFSDSIRVRQTGLNANGKRVFAQLPWAGNGSNYVKPYTQGAQIEEEPQRKHSWKSIQFAATYYETPCILLKTQAFSGGCNQQTELDHEPATDDLASELLGPLW